MHLPVSRASLSLLIGNKPMIQRVFEQASKSLNVVYVATDDKRIYEAVMNFGGKAVMTSPEHQSGTDRCAEAADLIAAETGRKIDVVINIQGDEPFIQPEQIDLLKDCFISNRVRDSNAGQERLNRQDIFNPKQPKVVLNMYGDAIYFSRTAIPYIRDAEPGEWAAKHVYYNHVGLYAYRTETLKRITPSGPQPP